MAKEKFMRELDELEHETKPEVKVAAPEKVPEVLISFGQWFSASGRQPQHRAGLMAFRSTEGRKTKDQWTALFYNY